MSLPKITKDHKRTHEENRYVICLLCFKKGGSMVKITNALQKRIKNLFQNYDETNDCLPLVVCNTCKSHLYNSNINSESVPKIDFPRLPVHVNTRLRASEKENEVCECDFCKMARVNINEKLIRRNAFSKSKKNETADSQMKTSPEKRCLNCLSVIGKGKNHVCSTYQQINNVNDYIQNTFSSEQKQQLTSMLLKHISTNKNKLEEHSNSSLALKQINGKLLRVSIGKCNENSAKKPLLSVADFQKIQESNNLSLNTTCSIAASIRSATQNLKVIEPNLKRKLSSNNHCLDEHFDVKVFNFVKSKANNFSDLSQTVAYCKNVDNLIKHAQQIRKSAETHIKIGIDGGGGFLKICLSIQVLLDKCESERKVTRQSYKDGISAKKFKDTSVNKLFILALAPSTQENYENVNQLWSELKLKNFNGTIATDLKLANILAGIMPHSSCYPCLYCCAHKNNLLSVGVSRTYSNILKNYTAWCESGSKKEQAKNFYGCIHPPIIETNEDKMLLELIPPPELHLMLGVVNTMYNSMLKEFESDALRWAKACHVQREITHGSPAFKGNSCKILLSKVDLLRWNCQLLTLKYVAAFENFNKVVKACFTSNLDPNFSNCISAFKSSYLDLGISVTPKVHIVFFHVEQFCKKMNQGLGFYSEQAIEAAHSSFGNFWNKYKVDSSNPNYAKQLLRALCEFNSRHV